MRPAQPFGVHSRGAPCNAGSAARHGRLICGSRLREAWRSRNLWELLPPEATPADCTKLCSFSAIQALKGFPQLTTGKPLQFHMHPRLFTAWRSVTKGLAYRVHGVTWFLTWYETDGTSSFFVFILFFFFRYQSATAVNFGGFSNQRLNLIAWLNRFQTGSKIKPLPCRLRRDARQPLESSWGCAIQLLPEVASVVFRLCLSRLSNAFCIKFNFNIFFSVIQKNAV